MHRKAHLKVARLAAAAMPEPYTDAMSLLWEGIETGATLPDELHLLWDTDDETDRISRVLMHRCYMDSDRPRDRGCALQIVRYATALPDFFRLYEAGEFEGVYDREEFLLNAGSYFGVIAHHIADLHTPVHVGRLGNLKGLEYRRAGGFHSKLEADLDRAADALPTISPYVPRAATLSVETYEGAARQTYDCFFLELPRTYAIGVRTDARQEWLQECVVNAAQCVANTWQAVLTSISREGSRPWR